MRILFTVFIDFNNKLEVLSDTDSFRMNVPSHYFRPFEIIFEIILESFCHYHLIGMIFQVNRELLTILVKDSEVSNESVKDALKLRVGKRSAANSKVPKFESSDVPGIAVAHAITCCSHTHYTKGEQFKGILWFSIKKLNW